MRGWTSGDRTRRRHTPRHRPGPWSELVDAVDAGDRDHPDQALCSLSRLAQNGHSLAGRVALQVMLLALSALPRRCRSSVETLDERRQMTLVCFYSVLHWLRAEGNIASRLMLETLHPVTAETRSSDASMGSRSIAVDDLAEREVDIDLRDVDEHSDPAELLVWAVLTNVLNVHEAQLLADSCLPTRRPAHGKQTVSRRHNAEPTPSASSSTTYADTPESKPPPRLPDSATHRSQREEGELSATQEHNGDASARRAPRTSFPAGSSRRGVAAATRSNRPMCRARHAREACPNQTRQSLLSRSTAAANQAVGPHDTAPTSDHSAPQCHRSRTSAEQPTGYGRVWTS